MNIGWLIFLVGAAISLVVLPQTISALGRWRGIVWGLALLIVAGGFGAWLTGSGDLGSAPADWHSIGSVPASACAKCHADHYDSWYRTYHRSMTQEATPENVKGNFNNVVYEYQGISTRLSREGDAFFMTTVDPTWALMQASNPDALPVGIPPSRKFRIDRLVGSHWVQECLHREPNGRYIRLPVLYSIVEQRWVHTHGAFLAPESPDFWGKSRAVSWNDTCLYCHNTGPAKNPIFDARGRVVAYDTHVAELGISCEACHGPGELHVRLNHHPGRRFHLEYGQLPDPSIVNPKRLSVERRDEICARCHGAIVPKPEAWDRRTHRDPFIAGLELSRFNTLFWSEQEQARLARQPAPTHDGRFWGDGTPMTTALEYNGMALSACYQKGQGNMSCLSCHQLHGDDPNMLLKPGMRSNEACLQCHTEYRHRLEEHTRHAVGSAGSQCMNCHMPPVVFSLLTTHRSHRIEIPRLESSLGTGKPHACNLCHLDKSLGWTQQELAKWSGKQSPVALSEDEKNLSHMLLMLATHDARTRVIVAGAFNNPAARQATRSQAFAPFLVRLLEAERYPMVRTLLHRALISASSDRDLPAYDPLATPPERQKQCVALRRAFDQPLAPTSSGWPVDPQGQPDEAVLRRLLQSRQDPDVTINE